MQLTDVSCYNFLSELSKKIGSIDLHPVFTSRKIIDDNKDVEAKPPLINQHYVVFKFSCDLCDTDYVGYTSQHLFQCVTEPKHSSVVNTWKKNTSCNQPIYKTSLQS